jgi:signal transduction histidine kinase
MRSNVRILYAEDNVADADTTRSYLERHAPDLNLEVVSTGARCLERMAAGSYDLLLLDNRLPDMDGIDVLKELIGERAAVPVVMVTGGGDEALVVQALRLGAWDYIPKQGDYIETLPTVLRNAVIEYRWRHDAGLAMRQRQRRVLYIEHNPADIDLTLRQFAEAAPHCSFDVVHSASDGLALLQDEAYDLVLSDLRLSDMNALDLLREVRRRGLTVPFIIATGRGDEDAAVAALKLGAFDYIVKRDNYLIQLPYAIDHAIVRSELVQANRRLQSELKERERLDLENARLLAETRQAVQARDEFLAIAAHEIRGPLMAMRLAVQSMRTGRVPADDVPGVMDIVEREDRKLAQFVDELLDLGRIRAGVLSLAIEAIDLRDVVRDVVARLRGDLARSGSTVSVSCTGEPVGRWDRSRLDQIVTNLVQNAIKFGLGRPIDMEVITRDASVQLIVADRGTGIPLDRQERIFRPFESERSARNYGGLGLGLYIVRGIAQSFGGNVTVKSEPGAGSTFTVELPRLTDQ